jgi:3-methyladenine DNA glycosylase AlkD
MSSSSKDIIKELRQYTDPGQASILRRFFKTGAGEYGEGDIFWGIKMPVQREVVKNNLDISLDEIQKLLGSKIHEQRMTALLILTYQFKKKDEKSRQEIFDFYLKNTRSINNWDLVDVTCTHIVGEFLKNKPRDVLYKLAKSDNLWEKRIAIISTLSFIRQDDYIDTLEISRILLNDRHDLIHKAIGWMLREVGKRDQKVEELFLDKYFKEMSRTTLRYAIERFPEKLRKEYLNLK